MKNSGGHFATSEAGGDKTEYFTALAQGGDWMAHQQGLVSGNSASTTDFQSKANNTASGKRIEVNGVWSAVGPTGPSVFCLALDTSGG